MATLKRTDTILVCDDEPFMLTLASSMLTSHGYKVLSASNANEVLHMFKTCPDLKIDLALIDMVLPGLNGTDLALHLSEIHPTMPIIFMSAYSENAELRPERFRKVIFLAKPFNLDGRWHRKYGMCWTERRPQYEQVRPLPEARR